MPLRDGTGPLGKGPKTGHGAGNCVSTDKAQPGFGAGRGRACGRGCGRGPGFGQAGTLPDQDKK